MDNRQLSYFLAIVEEGGITKAAEKLHLAQPYLSQMLKNLEDELGVTLIDRTTRKFKITEAGQLLSYRARQILDLSEATQKEMKDFNEGLKGVLSMGCLSTAIETVLTDKIYDFHRMYPGIDFEIRQQTTDEILELLRRGIVEIGVIRAPFNSEYYESIPLPMGTMVAVSSNEMNLRGMDGKLSLRELSDKPLMVHRRFEKDIVGTFRKNGLKPRILCRIEDTRPLLLLAQKGMGAAIVPRDWTKLIPDSNLISHEIPELSINTGIVTVWLKNHYLSLAARHFLELFR